MIGIHSVCITGSHIGSEYFSSVLPMSYMMNEKMKL